MALPFIAILPVRAQAPALAWTNNIGARVFAVDAQNNVYASSNGNVIQLSSTGATLQSNSICPLPALAQMDAAGNYYFLGKFDGTQDFGGITIMGGWTNQYANQGYEPGYPTCFLAKYAHNGSLQWVTGFGLQSYRNNADDLVLNPDGSLTVGFDGSGPGYVAMFSPSGSNLWQTAVYQYNNIVKVGPLKGNQGAILEYTGLQGNVLGAFYNSNGIVTQPGFALWHDWLAPNAEPLLGTNNDLWLAGLTGSEGQPSLTRWNASGEEFNASIGSVEQWTLAEDGQGNIYLGGGDGSLSKYDANGALIWSGNYGSPVVAMMLDAQGNRYISRNDGSVGKLLPDSVASPIITNAPVGGEIFTGSNFTFSVGAFSYAPLNFQWTYQGPSLPQNSSNIIYISGATNSTLTLSNATAAQNGFYSVIVSNVAGAVTSAPVTLLVKTVAVFDGSQMLTNGAYTFSSPPTLAINSAFTNGEIYYTMDGSSPNFLSILYSGPFMLTTNATINAISYSADFSQSAYADTVVAAVPPQFTLNANTAGGGTIALNPPGGMYASNTVVTATAIPAAGYTFLYWQGAASGAATNVNVMMNQNQSLSAVFGTRLSTTVQGNGKVVVAPGGGVYPYGSTVRLEALPQPGSYFGAWGNAASGGISPLNFTITNPTPTVSSLFVPLSSGQSSLTLLVLGHGKVSASPTGNFFANTATVSLTATPDAGQTFLYWSSDASGTQSPLSVRNPLGVGMGRSWVIVAHFSGQEVAMDSHDSALTSQGFQLNLIGEPTAVYQIFASSNFTTWQSAGFATNDSGVAQFMDTTAKNAPCKYYRAKLVQ